MTAEYKPGVRYRMPSVFGPAPGPRQKADGTPWTLEETGTMNSTWMTVSYLSRAAQLEKILPPGFALRGDPIVHASLAFFNNLYWLAGRGYGIVYVDIPVTHTGKSETIAGGFCPVLWEGAADAIVTGRDELGFSKLYADIPPLKLDIPKGTAGGEASHFGHKFFDIELHGLKQITGDTRLPGSDGAALHYKYMPRTSIFGKEGKDFAYVTSSQPLPGSGGTTAPIKTDESKFKKWKGSGGTVHWHRATFQQQPTTFHVVNGMADLDIVEVIGAEMVEFHAPGVAVWANSFRVVEPAV